MNCRLILPACSALLATPLSASVAESTVPIPAVTSVKAAYPRATPIEWDYDGDRNLYEAEFRIERYEYEVVVNAEGKIVLVKAEVPASALPPAATASVRQRCPEGRIEKVKKITRNDSVRYKVELEDAHGDIELYVDPRGNILHEKR